MEMLEESDTKTILEDSFLKTPEKQNVAFVLNALLSDICQCKNINFIFECWIIQQSIIMVCSKPIRTCGKLPYIAFQEPDELLVPVSAGCKIVSVKAHFSLFQTDKVG